MVALGFQVCDGYIANVNDGKPMVADLFDDPAFEMARREATETAAMIRRMGEFQPARLSQEAMEYTTLPQILEKLKDRFKPS